MKISLRKIAAALAWPLIVVLPAEAATYHVRVDGGSATQCTGRANAAYPGTGTGQACAWAGLLVALPPGGAPRIAGGDTLLVHTGSYPVGYGAPGSEGCSSGFPWDCFPAAIPSGTATQPTRILGDGYAGTCASPPQLWGTERVHRVLNLVNTRHAEVSCLEITDHSDCVLSHTGSLACERASFPYGTYGDTGIHAYNSSNVKLSKLNIHGMAVNGVHAWNLTDWTVNDVRIATSGWVGWNGDSGSTDISSSNSGTLKFTELLVEYNGCGEGLDGQPAGCWNDSASGYGDGFGTAHTGGNWIFEDSTFRYNTSDGLDLLYHTLGGSIVLNRVRASGNAGNQLKVHGSSAITNAVVHGNCGYFSRTDLTYTYVPLPPEPPRPSVADCRAAGDAVVVEAENATDALSIYNSTIVSEGNVTIAAGGPPGSTLRARNNIVVGLTYFLYTPYMSADLYVYGGLVADEAYAVKQSVRNVNCTTPSTICANAGLKAATAIKLDPHLKAGSPARDSGLTTASDPLVPTVDYFKNMRGLDGFYDRGASEDPPAAALTTKSVRTRR